MGIRSELVSLHNQLKHQWSHWEQVLLDKIGNDCNNNELLWSCDRWKEFKQIVNSLSCHVS